jgi:hypothetical protein
MDDDDFQQMVDYENEIYDLNHGEGSESDVSVVKDESESDEKNAESHQASSDNVSEHLETAAEEKVDFKTEPNGVDEHFDDEDSESLSEDERDLIYSRLYHSTSTLPASTTAPSKENKPNRAARRKQKALMSCDQPSVPSTEFTFHLDLDLPPPPAPTEPSIAEAVPEASALDEDGDYSVLSLKSLT